MASGDVEDFIEQNRQLADQVETYRTISESEKHWKSRREFILRNINDFEDPHLDHLLALSMVWANNVFLGCRYSPDLLERVQGMAEGVVVEDAPVFKTRDEIVKQQKQRN
ncbi:CDKN2AIP N-terminal-like protein [Engraulis encrasicolus]|uniref:CDKN2AIP N-terminal-like protein n=1 Tax=Engraulis encrasicolus TaxID=184585 RepID=UPI002FD50E23